MLIEAKKPNCCSHRRVLTLDGRPWGEAVGRVFGESIAVRLTGSQRYLLKKKGSWRSRFDLVPEAGGEAIATAESGVFERGWRILLPSGRGCVMQPDGVFRHGFTAFDQSGEAIARVSHRQACTKDIVAKGDGVDPLDLLVVALVYQVVANRRAAAAASG